MSDHSADIPRVLPIIPIRNKVLIPGGEFVLQVVSKGSVQLLQRIYRSAENKESKYIIGCVPLQSPSYIKFEPKDNNSSAIPFTLTRNGNNGNRNSTPKKTIEEIFNQATQPSDLYEFGCAAKIDKLERTINGFVMIVRGIVRIHVDKYVLERPYLEAEVTVFPDPFVPKDDQELQELANSLRSIGRELHLIFQNLKSSFPTSFLAQFQKDVENAPAGVLADLLINAIECTYEERLEILDAHDLKTRMTIAIGLLTKWINMIKVTQKVHSAMNKHKEFYLRQHFNALNAKEELGERDDSSNEDDDITDLTKRIREAGLSPEADKAAQRELKRLKRMHPTQAEYQVVRTYLEWLSEIPWSKSTTDILDTDKARQQLNDDHYGLESVKKRVLEYLAVLKLKGDLKGPILCLLGPPGVGKTSLGKSIANSLGRKFHRISLGGVRDEAEIRGHRRTYVGAMPGLIAQGLRRVGVNNPIFLLDEIDKVGHLSNHGDPSAALLEVLDPEQNNTFNDHYLNVPLDLSKVLFIATANQADTIPAPLLDRMELINIPGYTFDEKINIAQRHLLPKQILNHGLSIGDVKISDELLLKIASGYTREAGVRNFEREIAGVCRAKAVEYANAKDKEQLENYNNEITAEEIENILGVTKFDNEVAERTARPGVVTGLVWTASGSGGILFIEATQMAGKGNLLLTGKLGEVIRESAKIALSWVRANAFQLGITTSNTESTFFFERDVHIHFPAGAVGKDGPSAGVALTVALVSLLTNRRIPPTTAMTGEITLRGQVLPVGGIKEKIIGAHRAGIKKVILPTRNRKDVEGDVPVNVKNEINFVYANSIFDVLQGAFEGEKIWSDSTPIVEFASRL